MSDNAMVRWPHSNLRLWNDAHKAARESLGLQGFVKMGKGEQGQQLLHLTRAKYNLLLGEGGAHGVQ